MALASVSVDLDSLGHYCRIHGLSESALSPTAARAIYREALPRLLELFAEERIRATFFAVGQDLEDGPSAGALREAAEEGHEIGNHSFGHDYALTRRPPAEIGDELARGAAAIERTVGRAPIGFRAPGYTLTGPLLQALIEQEYRYDASVFPAAPYWAAKAVVMAGLAALGRRSRAILDRPRVLVAPRLPYRPDPDEPYRRGRASLVELPMTVHPLTRLPIIGTTVTMLAPRVFGTLWRGVARMPFVSLELHGIDLLDAQDAACPPLAAAQRDLAVPRATKRARLKDVLRRIADGFEPVPLAAAAERVSVS